MASYQISFFIDQKEFKYSMTGPKLIVPPNNESLIPYHIKRLVYDFSLSCPSSCLSIQNRSYPYLNPEAFKLFMNLILTPTGMKIYNPKGLTLEDLEPIFETFLIDNERNCSDGCLLNRLKERFNK